MTQFQENAGADGRTEGWTLFYRTLRGSKTSPNGEPSSSFFHKIKELLYLCTKNVNFSFNNEIYMLNDGIAMGSPLGPVFGNIFMAELERNIPSPSDKTKF